jgi:hypothetical protein
MSEIDKKDRIAEIERRLKSLEDDYDLLKRKYLLQYEHDNDLLRLVADKIKRYGERIEALAEISIRHSEYLWPEGNDDLRERLQKGMRRTDKPL